MPKTAKKKTKPKRKPAEPFSGRVVRYSVVTQGVFELTLPEGSELMYVNADSQGRAWLYVFKGFSMRLKARAFFVTFNVGPWPEEVSGPINLVGGFELNGGDTVGFLWEMTG